MYGGREVGRYQRRATIESLRQRIDDEQQQQQPGTHHLLQQPADLSWPEHTKVTARSVLVELRKTFASSGLPVGTLLGPIGLEQAAINAAAGVTAMFTHGFLKMHIGCEVTLSDCKGKTTFWGQMAGSGPTILRRSIEWAMGQDLPPANDIEAIGQRFGSFHDLWSVSTQRPRELLAASARACRILTLVPAACAKHRQLPTLLVLYSFEVGRVVRFGWEASPWVAAVTRRKPKVLESAGRLAIVAVSGDQKSLQTLAISCPHPGVAKKDPLGRREWLELIDLVCLTTHVAEAVLQKVEGSVCICAMRGRRVGLWAWK